MFEWKPTNIFYELEVHSHDIYDVLEEIVYTKLGDYFNGWPCKGQSNANLSGIFFILKPPLRKKQSSDYTPYHMKNNI